MISILSSLIILIAVIVCCIRIIKKSGLNIRNEKIDKIIFRKEKKYISYKATNKDVADIAVKSLLFRIGIIILSVVIIRLIMPEKDTLTLNKFLEYFNIWDAKHYLRVAEHGYKYYLLDGQPISIVFFPLYPLLIKVFNFIFRNYIVSGLIISIICYVIGCCYLFKFVCLEYGKNIAYNTVIFISIFPWSFFFGTVMTESLFFMLVISSIYYMKKKKWFVASILGFYASLTRMQGILLLIPACIEFLEEYKVIYDIKKKEYKNIFINIGTKFIFLLIIPLGTVVYLILNNITTGKFFTFAHYQEKYWGEKAQYFGKTISQVISNIFKDNSIEGFKKMAFWIPDLVIIIFVIALIVYGLNKLKNRDMLFLIVYVMVAYSLPILYSGARYMSCAIPMFIILGIMADDIKKSKIIITISFSMLFGVYYMAYLMEKFIM